MSESKDALDAFEQALSRLSLDSVGELAREGDGFVAASASEASVGALRLRVPARADGALHVEHAASGLAIEATLLEAEPVDAVATGASVVALGQRPQSLAILRRIRHNAADELVRLPASAKPELHYRVSLHGIESLSLVGRQLEFYDARGLPRLRFSAPTIFNEMGQARHGWLRVDGCAYDTDPGPPLQRALVPVGSNVCAVTTGWDDAGLSGAVLVTTALTGTEDLGVARVYHTATRLADGRVLVVGGLDPAGLPVGETEYFDPTLLLWFPGKPLNNARYGHTATLVDGVVVVLGGADGQGAIRRTERLKDFNIGWEQSPDAWDLPVVPRVWHTATLVGPSIFVIGGGNKQTQVFKNAAGLTPSWETPLPLALEHRFAHTAQLAQGRIFVMGGTSQLPDPSAPSLSHVLDTVESYGTTSSDRTYKSDENKMNNPRAFHTKTLLPTGAPGGTEAILVIGGDDEPERFNVLDGSWVSARTDAKRGRLYHTAELIGSAGDDQRVLVIGGQFGGLVYGKNDVYSPADNEWTEAPLITSRRKGHTATLLDEHSLLIAGGAEATLGNVTNDSELITFLARGKPCVSSVECVTQSCVGGVCCNQTCAGDCQTCLHDEGAPADGTCGPKPDRTACGIGMKGVCMQSNCRLPPTPPVSAGAGGEAGSGGDGGAGNSGGTPTGGAGAGGTAGEAGDAGAGGAIASGGTIASGGNTDSGGSVATGGTSYGGTHSGSGGNMSGGAEASGGTSPRDPDKPALEFLCSFGSRTRGSGSQHFAAFAAFALLLLGRRRWRA